MSFISESITEVVVNYTTVCFEALTEYLIFTKKQQTIFSGIVVLSGGKVYARFVRNYS
ncbi:hypothetical protein [Acetivibrio cellulolyticus]